MELTAVGYHSRVTAPAPTREKLLHALYEAAEFEHTLMCTYLYAAFSLKSGGEGLSDAQATAVASWRETIVQVAIEEMAHLVSIWNLTSALGGAPRFGRDNFPLAPGNLPASIVVRLAPFSEATLQHFTHIERPATSSEPEGPGFKPSTTFVRGTIGDLDRVTPMIPDYATVGEFYSELAEFLRVFAAQHGDAAAFCGDPALQLSADDSGLAGIRPVVCAKTALAALELIIEQGEGAPGHVEGSHFNRFAAIRDELASLRAADPSFAPAFPAAHNPVLRSPPQPEGRVWIEDPEASRVVDLASSVYGLMMRLLALSYSIEREHPGKRDALDLSMGLMHALVPLGERAARLPAGPSYPGCHAGVSFTALRDAAAFPVGPALPHYVGERVDELIAYAHRLAPDERVARALRILEQLRTRASRAFAEQPVAAALAIAAPAPAIAASAPLGSPPVPTKDGDVETIEGTRIAVIYEGKRCIHSRFCVTGAPQVFLANVQGPWIQPDGIAAERLVEIAHACPSGAIRYRRKDGGPEETAPPVNLISIRERGPYAVHADLKLDGQPPRFRATLCRCGASHAKPFCDGSHNQIGFAATGEPPTTDDTAMLDVRSGELAIEPELDGPLHVRGNVELISGTGRMVARLRQAKLCRCGGSANKPFCDGTHRTNGFRSE